MTTQTQAYDIPDLLATLQAAPTPPFEHFTAERMSRWIREYERWYHQRCAAIAAATGQAVTA